MAAWADWTPDVAIDVPACPTFTIERAVKQTVIDFCERTHWVKRNVAPIDVTGGASARTFATPVIAAGECVLAVLRAWLSGDELKLYAPEDVEDEWPDWKTLTGSPEALVQESIDTYYIVPSPTGTLSAALRLKVAIGYTDAATTCDDTIRQHWRDAIANGAKARLLSILNKPWSAPPMAAAFHGLYLDAVKGASVRALRSPLRRPLSVKPYFF